MTHPEKIYISPYSTFECGCEQASRIGEEGDVEYLRKDLAEVFAKEYALELLKSISERFCSVYCEYHGDIVDEEIAELEKFINSRKAEKE